MADNEDEQGPTSSSPLTLPSSLRPTITLPPRPIPEAIFTSAMGVGFSPGPMTLVTNFFTDNDDFKSFSQLLAGAMASPSAILSTEGKSTSADSDGEFLFKQSKVTGLTISPPPSIFGGTSGISSASFLDSPGMMGLFSPGQGPFGMTHQQALAQVTALAAQSRMSVHPEYTTSLSPAAETSLTKYQSSSENPSMHQHIVLDSVVTTKEVFDLSQSDRRSQISSVAVDKPADDGFNWRKYGQKQVKGSEYPRSYYKCTYHLCVVKKKVERSLDGQVTEIIYKGQHNHEPPQHSKQAKDTRSFNESSSNAKKMNEGRPTFEMSRNDQECSQATPEHQSDEEVGDTETVLEEKDKDEPDPKRRNTEVVMSSSQRTVTEPKIIVQTTSEVDLLDDGYRWRKYGQKVVKGNPYPRSYYKCTTPGCNVRKHVERAATDPKAVVTTYEGKHSHDVPVAKSSSHNTANSHAYQLKSRDQVQENRHISTKMDSGNRNQQPVGRLQLKEEEQVT